MIPKTKGLNPVTIQHLHDLPSWITNFVVDNQSSNLSLNFKNPLLLPSDKLLIETVGLVHK